MGTVDQVTQRNASAAEELSSTAEEMAAQAAALQQIMGFFVVDEKARGNGHAQPRRPATNGAARPRPPAAAEPEAARPAPEPLPARRRRSSPPQRPGRRTAPPRRRAGSGGSERRTKRDPRAPTRAARIGRGHHADAGGKSRAPSRGLPFVSGSLASPSADAPPETLRATVRRERRIEGNPGPPAVL
jgi:hypothetical protein